MKNKKVCITTEELCEKVKNAFSFLSKPKENNEPKVLTKVKLWKKNTAM